MPVVFAGFKSDTWRLQQAGWQLSVREDPMRDSIQLALRHSASGLLGFSQAISDVYWRREAMREAIVFHVQQLFQADMVRITFPVDIPSLQELNEFGPIDAMPAYTDTLGFKEGFGPFANIFAPALVRTEEIIVDPARIAEHLEAIRKAQLPEQEAIRVRSRNRERREAFQAAEKQPVFHAQILSIAA